MGAQLLLPLPPRLIRQLRTPLLCPLQSCPPLYRLLCLLLFSQLFPPLSPPLCQLLLFPQLFPPLSPPLCLLLLFPQLFPPPCLLKYLPSSQQWPPRSQSLNQPLFQPLLSRRQHPPSPQRLLRQQLSRPSLRQMCQRISLGIHAIMLPRTTAQVP